MIRWSNLIYRYQEGWDWPLRFASLASPSMRIAILGTQVNSARLSRDSYPTSSGWSYQWIGLRENLQENPIFNGTIYGFRFRFSLKPIHWSFFPNAHKNSYEEKQSSTIRLYSHHLRSSFSIYYIVAMDLQPFVQTTHIVGLIPWLVGASWWNLMIISTPIVVNSTGLCWVFLWVNHLKNPHP